MTKILYSPGFGCGWSTWASSDNPEFEKFMLTYPPLIEALERGEKLNPDEPHIHPALHSFLVEAKEKFGEDYICVRGARNLCVTEVSGPFRIDEYDGNERVIEASTQTWTTL